MYAEASGYRILLAAIEQQRDADRLPPFSLVYKYGGASDPVVTWAEYQRADQLAGHLENAGIYLPIQQRVRSAATEKLQVRFPDGQGKEVTWVRLGFMSGLQEKVRLVHGAWPSAPTPGAPIEVLVPETTASKNTLLAGDTYRLQASSGPALDVPIRIAGIWRPIDPEDNYWFDTPAALSDVFLVSESGFTAIVGVQTVPLVRMASWYTVLDGTSVRSADVAPLTEQISTITADTQQLLTGTRLTRSPIEALVRHREQVRVLIVTLALFSVPLMGLIGYFIVQVAGMVVQRQQQEVAVLRSRGISRIQVLGLALGEGLILSIAALVAGVPLGLGIAQVLLWTRSFLSFALLPGPPPELLATSWLHGALVVTLALPAILFPALRSAGRTIVSFKLERARGLHRPWWQRAFLDILLLIPAVYGYQQLRLHGLIGVPGIAEASDDPFRNPVLLLAPALLVFALALVALRFLPGILALLAWLFSKAPGVALLTALRFLSRTPSAYSGPVLLITLTLSLAAFTASMARTMDQHSFDRARYRSGADLRLAYQPAVTGASTGSGPISGPVPSGGVSQSGAGPITTSGSADYLFVPIEEYLSIPGVQTATRVAPSDVEIATGAGPGDKGVFLGVDRQMLAMVLDRSWRTDYAGETLGALMNRLADSPNATLVSTKYAAQRGLRIGDRFILRMNDLGGTQEVPFVVAGMIDYFPTQYPEGKPFVIGNLDYSFEAQSSQYPYQIWMALAPNADPKMVAGFAYGYGLRPLPETPAKLLEADLLRPERQGLFGLLSVGFLATTVITVIGFLAYTLLSFQRRLVEMGVLRAIGLGSGQLGLLLIFEQALVIGIGTALGTGLGILASRMFVPFLQVRTGEFPDTPPFLVQIAWDQIGVVYLVAGAMLLVTVGTTLILLRRMRIFEAVKLGESV